MLNVAFLLSYLSEIIISMRNWLWLLSSVQMKVTCSIEPDCIYSLHGNKMHWVNFNWYSSLMQELKISRKCGLLKVICKMVFPVKWQDCLFCRFFRYFFHKHALHMQNAFWTVKTSSAEIKNKWNKSPTVRSTRQS